MKTELLSVAKAELEKLLSEEATCSELHGNDQVNPRLTMGEARQIRLHEITNDVVMKKATQHYWSQIAESLWRSWPELEDLESRKITPAMCQGLGWEAHERGIYHTIQQFRLVPQAAF